MRVEMLKGKNVPSEDGTVSPAKPGDVVDLPDKLGRKLVIQGAAAEVKEKKPEVKNPESSLKEKIAKR